MYYKIKQAQLDKITKRFGLTGVYRGPHSVELNICAYMAIGPWPSERDVSNYCEQLVEVFKEVLNDDQFDEDNFDWTLNYITQTISLEYNYVRELQRVEY